MQTTGLFSSSSPQQANVGGGSSLIGTLGAALVLVFGVVLLTGLSLDRTQTAMVRFLAEKGVALVTALEAHSGLTGLIVENTVVAEKGGALIGVNTFTLGGDEAAISEAKDVLAKKGATYQNVYFDSDGEAGKFTTNIFAYPTTYVVDRSGNIVGEPIVGAITEKKQAETLQKLIDQALAADMG